MTEKIFLHLSKGGQGESSVFFQTQIIKQNDKSIERKKAYLVFSLSGKRGHIRLSEEKPEDAQSAGLCANILRKNLPTGQVDQILQLESGDWVILVQMQKKFAFMLRLDNSGPIFFELITANQDSLLRYGPTGTFSKRKIASNIPDEGQLSTLKNQLPTLIAEATQKQSANKHPALEISSPQRQIKKKLKRRLRTVNKSLKEQKSHQASLKETLALEQEIQLLEQQGFVQESEVSGVGRQLNELYTILKKKKRSTYLAGEQIDRCQKEILELNEDLARLENTAFKDLDLLAIAKKWRLNSQQISSSKALKKVKASPYREFFVDGQTFYVAKSAEAGDRLIKKAKGNDLWFHVVGKKGAHVLAPAGKNALSDKAQRAGAILALFFVKNHGNGEGEVYFTQRHHLKKDGNKPGLWKVEKAQILAVRYTQLDIQEIFQSGTARP